MASTLRPRINSHVSSPKVKRPDTGPDVIIDADADSPSTTIPRSINTKSASLTTQVQRKGHPQLISYHDLPEWYEGNEYIHHGYRPPSHSVRVSALSVLALHNESINIYTHLIPAIVFLVSPSFVLHHLHQKYIALSTTDDITFVLFLLSAAVCLAFSTFYHTFANHSERVDEFWLRMDFAGIVLLTVGDFVSGIYMVFWCESVERIVYWSMVRLIPFLGHLYLASFYGPPRFCYKALQTN